MNILILGDSWAYSWPIDVNGDDSLDFEFTLFNKGNFVINKSLYGGHNLQTLKNGKNFINFTKPLGFKVDLIVWMFTELLRDLDCNNDKDELSWNHYEGMLEYLNKKTIDAVNEIRMISPESKWAIIGGHVPLYKPEQYSWADFVVEDWRSEILGVKLPACHSLSFQERIYENRKTLGDKVVEEEFKKYDIINNAIKNAPEWMFPDGVHPCLEIQRKMAIRIHEHFQNTNS